MAACKWMASAGLALACALCGGLATAQDANRDSVAAAGNSAAAMVTEEAGRAGPGPQMAAGHVVSPSARPTATTRGTPGPVTTVVPTRPPAARGQGAGASTVGGGEVAAASTAGVR